MPITKSAKKALRQQKRRTVINKRLKNKYKKAIKTAKSTPSLENLKKLYSLLDKAAKKKIIHKNKAARLKSRITKSLLKKIKNLIPSSNKRKTGEKVIKK